MSAKLKEIIEESFSHPESLSPDNMKELIQETMRFFYQIHERLTSKEEAIRSEAMEEATQLKALLEEQVAKLCAHLGKTPEEVLAMADDRKRFSAKEWESLDEAQSEITHFKEELKEEFEEPALAVVPKTKHKKLKTRIVG